MTKVFFLLMVFNGAWASTPDETVYRQLALNVRKEANFKVPLPNGQNLMFSYAMQIGKAMWLDPISYTFPLDFENKKFYRHFWDKIFLEDGSAIKIGNENVPLTCLYLEGQDNRSSKDTPLTPDFVLKIYLVANDFPCTGPVNPGWPANGGKKEIWDTYIYYEIRDPTIMLPMEIKIRHRWVEFSATLELSREQ